MLPFILFLIFVTVGMVSYSVVPSLYSRASVLSDKRQQKFSAQMEQVLSRQEARRQSQLLIAAPIALGILFYFLFPPEIRTFGVVVGLTGGWLLPTFYIRILKKRIAARFDDQLIDALMIMSSSFRGGLSLIQAFEAVCDEMPDPIRKEFGIVLGENKMGVSLEEALYHLYNRMPSAAMQQMITAILLARETGGNLPVIFNRIVNNIRETKKIQQNLDTLTIQGKIQGGIMSILPLGFFFIVYSTNKRIFINMVESDVGKMILLACFVLWVIGGYLIIKISTIKEF